MSESCAEDDQLIYLLVRDFVLRFRKDGINIAGFPGFKPQSWESRYSLKIEKTFR